jgi:hypothetical protein
MNWYKIYKTALEWSRPTENNLVDDMSNEMTDALPKEDYLVPSHESGPEENFSPEKEIINEISGLNEDDMKQIVNEYYDTIIDQAKGCFEMHMDAEDTIDKIATEIAKEVGISTKPSLEWASFNTQVFGVIQDNFPEEVENWGTLDI